MTKAKLISALALTAVLGGALAATAQSGFGPRGEGPRGPAAGGFMRGIDGPMLGHLTGLVWDEADANGDGQVTADEVRAALEARFAAADADGDGLLSAEELAGAIKALEEARADRRRLEIAKRILDRADDNADGKVSTDELRVPRAPEAFLKRFDKDGDGVVSKAEYDAAVKAMRDRFQERRAGAERRGDQRHPGAKRGGDRGDERGHRAGPGRGHGGERGGERGGDRQDGQRNR